MAKGSAQKRDAAYGRQGGRVVAWDDEPIDFTNLPTCDRCGGGMVCGQPGRHWMCCDVCPKCYTAISPTGKHRCVSTSKSKKQASLGSGDGAS